MAATERAERVALKHNWSVAAMTSPQTGFVDFNALLHELRSVELARMPPVSGTMLSAGCSGTLYFDWIARCYGTVDRHIGLELYLPQPPVLPPEVEWIKNSVADMDGVASQSVDLVFSGQNVEHLFGDDAADFLLECHRVVRTGGWLVMDSPDRDIAAALGWTQPEHTIEFTSAEATELVELAGFDVADVRGVWLCREPSTGEVLPMWGTGANVLEPAEILRRGVSASTAPEHSFVWWLEAKRADREPDVENLRRRHAEIFATAWPERQQRLLHAVGTRTEAEGRQIVHLDAGVAGFALFGPYMPLLPGRYDVAFGMRRTGAANGNRIVELDVCDGAGTVLTSRSVTSDELPDGVWSAIGLPFEVGELTWGGQFRVRSTGRVALDVEFGVTLREFDASPAPTFPVAR
jgi:SAM-dependent methyltransferase